MTGIETIGDTGIVIEIDDQVAAMRRVREFAQDDEDLAMLLKTLGLS